MGDRLGIYVDLDGVMANFMKAYIKLKGPGKTYPQSEIDFWRNLEPIDGAIHAFQYLSKIHDVWILTAPSVPNPMCYAEKRIWVEDHLGIDACQRLIISPDKSLFIGDILIDDTLLKGVLGFTGRHIHFGNTHVSWDGVMIDILSQREYSKYIEEISWKEILKK